ncbi:hypothetical protein [Longispora albida]|uniref:hypothetical protein n=1 Tax=Longispora albida TaxID=203523 RepID=UPI0003807480|nr:hypothetical protein [Longispora albida]
MSGPSTPLGEAIRQESRTVHELTEKIWSLDLPAAYGEFRFLDHLVQTDLAMRVESLLDCPWLHRGSFVLPCRAGPEHPGGVIPIDTRKVDARYVLARKAQDVDMVATDLPGNRDDHLDTLMDVAHRLDGAPGLAGLVQLELDGKVQRLERDRRVSAGYRMVPVQRGAASVPDTRVLRSRRVRLDLGAPEVLTLRGEPDRAYRPPVPAGLLGVDCEYLPMMTPLADQYAEKLALCASAGQHRFKDPFDLYYLGSFCTWQARDFHRALEHCPNIAKLGLGGPLRTFSPHGGTEYWLEGWAELIGKTRAEQPELNAYPGFPAVERAIAGDVQEIREAGGGAVAPRGWYRTDRDLSSAAHRLRLAREEGLTLPEPFQPGQERGLRREGREERDRGW